MNAISQRWIREAIACELLAEESDNIRAGGGNNGVDSSFLRGLADSRKACAKELDEVAESMKRTKPSEAQ